MKLFISGYLLGTNYAISGCRFLINEGSYVRVFTVLFSNHLFSLSYIYRHLLFLTERVPTSYSVQSYICDVTSKKS